MKLSVICFTQMGFERLRELLCPGLPGVEITGYCKCAALKGECSNYVEESVVSWAGGQFAKKSAILFIGSAGIAVRSIAPYVKDKLSDSAVLVMDDAAKHVIPLLSGHVGGANALAKKIADITGAEAVITTSTDVNGAFSVDVFAAENDLRIINREGIARVSAKALSGEKILIGIDEDIENGIENGKYNNIEIVKEKTRCDVWIGECGENAPDALLYLSPKKYVLGVGCRKGKSGAEIGAFAKKTLAKFGISKNDVACVASIYLKANEEGLVSFAESGRLEFKTFSTEELNAQTGDFTASDFVKQTVGVDSVAERAAIAACPDGGRLVVKKQTGDGLTLAAAERKVTLR